MMSADLPDLAPIIKSDEISYGERIGGGQYGDVYRGMCRGKEVAIKKLFKQDFCEKFLREFQREVEMYCRAHHPNIVLFMGACIEQGKLCIVTELLQGDVQTLLERTDISLSMYRRLKIAKDCAQGVNWLHCSNPPIIHRDLKLANLLVDKDGLVKVCDFGFAEVRVNEKICSKSIRGTPLYMAPEVLLGKQFDEKADVYAFAILLWEILTGGTPFAGASKGSILDFKRRVCRQHERPPIPCDMGEGLAKLLENCWDKNPNCRPSFVEILSGLDKIIIDSTLSDPKGNDLWVKYFDGMESIEWETFLKGLQEQVDCSPVILQPGTQCHECLRAMLASPMYDNSVTTPPMVVTMDQWSKVLGWFGPLDSTFLSKIMETLRNEWFHGTISRVEAEKVLRTHFPGTFLIRLSSTVPNSFSISKVSMENCVNHQRIDYDAKKGEFSLKVTYNDETQAITGTGTLADFVTQIGRQINLLRPCPGSPYPVIFRTAVATKLEGYL